MSLTPFSLSDFPLLNNLVDDDGKRLRYLDSAATSQKPQVVIDSLKDFYEKSNANVNRGIYGLGYKATEAYCLAREKVRNFINAAHSYEVIFTRGATSALNMLAYSYALPRLKSDDVIALTMAEHHSNLVPWQFVAKKTGAQLFYLPLQDDGSLNLADVEIALDKLKSQNKHLRIVTINHLSNVTGFLNPIKELAQLVHRYGAVLVVDAAQSIPHMKVDVQDLDVDFLTFSGHKMCGPTGIGVCYGRADILRTVEPFEYGGDMISEVDLFTATFRDLPARLEAGTPIISGAIGLAAAIDYLNQLGLSNIEKHDRDLVKQAIHRLQDIPGITIYGTQENRLGVVTFNIDGVHAHDVATHLDSSGIMIRAGHHCCQPLMKMFGLSSTVRASFYLYNDKTDIDALIDSILKVKHFFAKR